jgi:predicted nucleic acid-binding protein
VSESLVVDANPVVSALLGGVARTIVFSRSFDLYSTQHTMFEVARYLPLLARRLKVAEIDLLREFQLLPIIACQPDQYGSHIAEAERWIGGRDSRDVPILALTLCVKVPIWTEDRDFDGIPAISIRRTADLIASA